MSPVPFIVEICSGGCVCSLKLGPISGTDVWLPMGVAMESFGAVGLPRLMCGISRGCSPSPVTGRALGDGGIPSVSLGVLVPLWLRPPGTGVRRRGTGDAIVAGRRNDSSHEASQESVMP